MTEADRLLTHIHDLERTVTNGRRSTRAGKSSGRRRSDLQRVEQELQALRQRLDHTSNSVEANSPTEVSADAMERKLDSALVDSFPGSDAVSFLEPTLNKPSGTS